MDADGIIYYSDLNQVWMVLPDGSQQIAVSNVHSHELWLGPDGSVYGEDVQNEGEHYRHRVWHRHPDGSITNALPWREGHPVEYDDFSLARDGSGRSYVLRRAEGRIDVLDQDHNLLRSVALDLSRGIPGWLTVNEAGRVHLTVGPDVLRLDPEDDAPTVIARDLIERTEAFDFVQDRHALMGLWTDRQGNVYVSIYAGQHVKRIAPDGTVTVAVRSSGIWSPAGGLITSNGELWLLEFSSNNEARVRRID